MDQKKASEIIEKMDPAKRRLAVEAIRDAKRQENFEAMVGKLLRGGKSKTEAISEVVRKYPKLHEDYLRRYNRAASQRKYSKK